MLRVLPPRVSVGRRQLGASNEGADRTFSAFNASTSLAHCVVLPQRSIPSNRMKAPRGVGVAMTEAPGGGDRACPEPLNARRAAERAPQRDTERRAARNATSNGSGDGARQYCIQCCVDQGCEL